MSITDIVISIWLSKMIPGLLILGLLAVVWAGFWVVVLVLDRIERRRKRKGGAR